MAGKVTAKKILDLNSLPVYDNFYLVTADELINRLNPYQGRYITVDTETYPLPIYDHDLPSHVVRRWIGSGKSAKPQDMPFIVSMCDGTNCYSVMDSLDNDYKEFKKLKVILEDPAIEKIFHNPKFDMHMLDNIGIKVLGTIHDTVISSKLLDENKISYELKVLAKEYGGITVFEDFLDAYKKANKITDYRDFPIDLIIPYANADVWNCFLLWKNTYFKIQGQLLDLYSTEINLIRVLYDCERVGMRIRDDYEIPLKESLSKITEDAANKVFDKAEKIFNMNSTPQLYQVLMDLGVDPRLIPYTEKGSPCLDKGVLTKLSDNNIEIVDLILEYRKHEKLKTTYADGLYRQRDMNYYVHGNINQINCITGRMSINQPALQTLPKKEKRVRSAFIPTDGYTLVFMDLDQVEFRLFSHYANISRLIPLIKQGYDIHQATASLIYGVEYKDVVEIQRNNAKTLNFALIYGMGELSLAKALNMTRLEAAIFRREYFSQMPEAEPFNQKVEAIMKKRGFITNFYGRTRSLKYNETYKAVNSLIQGCAADYIKNKMVLIYNYLGPFKSRIIQVVHDELIFEIKNEEMHILKDIKNLLSDYDSFRVPITCGVEIGTPDWCHKKEIIL